jgi:hypothetical protein
MPRPWKDIVGPSPPQNLPLTPTVPVPVDNRSALERHSGPIAAGILGLSVVIGGWLFSRHQEPPDAPTPSPTPAVVVDTQLSKLLPNQTARGQAASLFRDVSYFVQNQQNLKTTGQVIAGVQAAVQMMQATNQITGLSAVNQPISDRIIKAVGGQPATGMPDIPLDQPGPNGQNPRAVLAREYAQISTDLRGS